MADLGFAQPIGSVVCTDVPVRLDRLQWSPWHRRVVTALGITWILDGLEASLVASLGPALMSPQALGLREGEIGLANTVYLIGQVCGALLFGHFTDRLGRKRLFLVTLAVYLLGTGLSGLAPDLPVFLLCRFVAGSGIGGEYSAINSAIDELIPARLRGQVDLGVNGSYWAGVAAGALLTTVLLDPARIPAPIGWRLAFLLGAALGLIILVVRRHIPESPRWLLMHGYVDAAERTIAQIEHEVHGGTPPPPPPCVELKVTGSVGFAHIARVLLQQHRRRTILGLALMISQAFFYNAVFFSSALILNRFFHVAHDRIGLAMVPVAVVSFLGPVLLGRLYDTIGRRAMISSSYILSGLLLAATGVLFARGWLTAGTQVVAWCVVFFIGSAAASSAYLTVSELFPVELRGMAIALFYSVATGLGALGPTIYGRIVETGSRPALFHGYLLGAGLMVAGGLVAAVLGVSAERKSLEQLQT